MGRRAYEMAEGDFTGYEFQVPIFVLTHAAPARAAKPSPGGRRGRLARAATLAGRPPLLLADIWHRLGDPRHEAAAAAAQEMFTRLGDRAGLAELRSVRAKGMQSELP